MRRRLKVITSADFIATELIDDVKKLILKNGDRRLVMAKVGDVLNETQFEFVCNKLLSIIESVIGDIDDEAFYQQALEEKLKENESVDDRFEFLVRNKIYITSMNKFGDWLLKREYKD